MMPPSGMRSGSWSDMMQPWFPEAKLGIFIHWGIYAVEGVAESWSWYQGQLTREQYFAQTAGFTAKNWDPAAWADLFVRAGAGYAVMTAKHHDGVALFDTRLNDLSVVKQTPAGRDLVAPFLQALRDKGLKTGLYFSHLDWAHPDYASVRNPLDPPDTDFRPGLSHPPAGVPDDPAAWERFLAFRDGQLQELCTQYGSLDLLWFDGEWERTPTQWRMKELRDQLQAWQPDCIFNARLTGYGDYETPEQDLPVVPPHGDWEYCVTMNNSWGYQGRDTNYKPLREIVRLFVETVSMGGNLLLDIGPMEDGTIPPEQVAILEGLGAWNARHGAAIFGCRGGLPAGHWHGPMTVSPDRRTLYLFFAHRAAGPLVVNGLQSAVSRARVLGSGQDVEAWRTGGAGFGGSARPLFLQLPAGCEDELMTVIALDLENELDLYRGAGRITYTEDSL